MRLLVSAIAIAALTAPALAQPAPKTPANVRGTIASSSASTIVVSGTDGSKTLSVGPKTLYLRVVKSSLDKVTSGTFVGTAVAPQKDGSLRALEVVIFPKSLDGTGEGFYPWDSQPHSMMANATVQHVGTSVSSVKGRTLALAYHGGQKTVDVPANVPVVLFEKASASVVRKTAHVFVVPAPSNASAAAVVAVGAGDLVPPM
ncbi:MAG: hypothetical protein NVSMB19_10030 [Vulcanimicrobiaceae bacterium]